MAQVYPTDGRADGGLLDGVLSGRAADPGTEDAVEDAGPDAAYPGGDEPVDEPEPIDVPEPPQTGDATVDEAVRLVAKAVRYPLEDQVPVYDAVHRGLQDRLADVED